MISPADFSRIMLFIEQNTGITIPESNFQQVQTFLLNRIGYYAKDIDSYITKVSGDQLEYSRLMEVVTINETYFFREEKQFTYLQNVLLPELNREQREICIWSSSCSSGEEALSLYAISLNIIKAPANIKIYASDISETVLDIFRKGIYRPNSFREDGSLYNPLIKLIAAEQPDHSWKIDPQHLKNIIIDNKNLFNPQTDTLPDMDIIFLRNTLIYMNMENKRIIIDNVVKKLKVGGVLFLAAAELPLISHPALSIEESEDTYFFRKRNPLNLSKDLLTDKISRAAGKELRVRPAPVKKTIETPCGMEDKICRIITMKLNNDVYKKASAEIEKTADFIIRIIDHAGRNDIEISEKMLAEFADTPAVEYVPGLYNYFLGSIEYQKGNNRTAEGFYRKALKLSTGLWPARFYLLKVLPADHKEIKEHITRLKKEISNYLHSHRWDYQFLLEGFNARYFLMICDKMYAEANRRDK